ncbi:MAG: ERF family protein [Methanosphaera sp.]|nr:ERF family protein [Methanosphaera sp.]
MLEKLLKIQQELKCNKAQYNSFGKYKYRSCEDILESVKPILNKYKCVIKLSDEMVFIGERYYIKANATIYDTETKEEIGNTAYAREELEKKGMDGSQITGTASSYARKYALNGLFAIDDTKDADTDEYTKQTKAASKTSAKDDPDYRKELIAYCKENKIDMNKVAEDYQMTGRKLSNDDYYDVLCELGWNGDNK